MQVVVIYRNAQVEVYIVQEDLRASQPSGEKLGIMGLPFKKQGDSDCLGSPI